MTEMLVIFSGCSGVGKNTVINEILKNSDKFALLPTYTTRDKRPGETDGCPYHFITDEVFKQKIEEGEFYEYESVHNHFYGTSRKLLEEKQKSGKILMKDIDVNGAVNLSRLLKDDIKIVTIFLYVENREILVERLIGRGEKEIDLRMKRYELEMQKLPLYDYVIDNEKLETTVELIERIIAFESEGKSPTVSSERLVGIDEEVAKEEAILREKNIGDPIAFGAVDGGFEVVDDIPRFVASENTGIKVARRAFFPQKQ